MPHTSAQLLAKATAEVSSIKVDRLEVHLYAGTAQVIDIREPDERRETGWIAKAVHAPRGLLEFWADPSSPSHRPGLDPTATTVVYCSAGQRSVLAAQTLIELGYLDVYWLDGGIQAWKQQGKAVVGLHPWHRDNDLSTTTINQG